MMGAAQDDRSDGTTDCSSIPTMTPTRVQRLLPEVGSIRGSMQSEVMRVLVEDIPDYFWLVRASEEHHCPDERGLGGLLLHTKRVFACCAILESTYRAMVLDDYETNCVRAAALLHDGFKYGLPEHDDWVQDEATDYHPYAQGHLSHIPQYTVTDHDVLMAAHVRERTSLPDEVARCIEAHGGSPDWYGHDGPKPTDDLEMLLHTADVFAANKWFQVPVYGSSRELRTMVGDVPSIEDESFVEW